MPPSLTFLVAETCVFVSMVMPLRWIRGRCPRIGKKLAQLNNCGYACANLLFVAWAGSVLLPELLHKESWSASLPQRGQVDMIFGVYFYSKAWEFLDIIFVSLMGIQPNLHFIVHHTTTPCLAWLVWTYRWGGFRKYSTLNSRLRKKDPKIRYPDFRTLPGLLVGRSSSSQMF